MELLTPDFGLFLWTLIAFVIVLILLGKFAWRPILNALKAREQGIADALANADKIKAEIAHFQKENESLLLKARDERAVILKEARELQEKMIAEAKDKAKIEYERIVAEAQQAIIQQKNATLTEVKNQVGMLVIELSEKVLQKQLQNREEQEKYVSHLAEKMLF